VHVVPSIPPVQFCCLTRRMAASLRDMGRSPITSPLLPHSPRAAFFFFFPALEEFRDFAPSDPPSGIKDPLSDVRICNNPQAALFSGLP